MGIMRKDDSEVMKSRTVLTVSAICFLIATIVAVGFSIGWLWSLTITISLLGIAVITVGIIKKGKTFWCLFVVGIVIVLANYCFLLGKITYPMNMNTIWIYTFAVAALLCATNAYLDQRKGN